MVMADENLADRFLESYKVNERACPIDKLGLPYIGEIVQQMGRLSHTCVLGKASENIHDKIGLPGQYGVAKLATRRSDGERFVVKIMSKARYQRVEDREEHFNMIRKEIEIMKQLSHENIVRLFDVYEDATHLFLVVEACTGGELFDQLQRRGTFSERDASQVLRQVVKAIAYLHRNKVAHCDLKPDNLLFLSKEVGSVLKVIDFGMSSSIVPHQHLSRLVGTAYYVAPEVIAGFYNEACDVWSIGVIMFLILFGFPPFWVDTAAVDDYDMAIYGLIKKGFTPVTKPGFGAFFPAHIKVSDSAKDLISKLLVMNVGKRLTAEEALEHPWLMGEDVSADPLPETVLRGFSEFLGRNQFRTAVLGIMTDSLPKSQLDQILASFKKMDKDGNGFVTLSELSQCLKRFPTIDAKTLMTKLDLDDDNKINYDELVKACVYRKIAAKEERLFEAFSRIDNNKDGIVTSDELKAALSKKELADSLADDLVKDADENKDGVVDYAEFLKIFDNQKKTIAGNKL